MKSLVHLSSSIVHPDISGSSSTKLCLNPDDGVLYAAAIDPIVGVVSVWYIALSSANEHECRLFATLTLPSTPDQGGSPTLIDIKALPESCQLCLITSDGQISVCSIEDQGAGTDVSLAQFDNIGTFEDGIRSVSWSPDDELLVIITYSDKLVILTKTFDVLCESQIEYGRFGDDQPISLGWGTKATQFHGSLGKSAAQASQTPVPSNNIQSHENSSDAYEISWRGDGAFFAITCPARKSDNNSTLRLVKVYSRAGALSSSSEAIPNSQLGDKIAWRPEGSIIASSVRDLQKERLNVIFFERNGLQRYGFDLNEIDSIVNIWGLAWNSDSSILAVGIEKRGQSNTAESPQHTNYAVQLWTRNNYHWYLKHEIQLDLSVKSATDSSPSMMWHPELPLCLYLSLRGGFVEMRKFAWEALVDPKPKPDDTGSVAVIDGYQILLTPFRYQVVPPPMSTFQLSTQTFPPAAHPRIPTHVAFSPRSHLLCALFPSGVVSCYLWQLSSTRPPRISLPRPTEGISFNLRSSFPTRVLCRQITIMDTTDVQQNGHDQVSVLVILFSEIDQENNVRDGVHIQRVENKASTQETLAILDEEKSTRFYASAGQEWWKIFTCGQDGCAYVQTNKGLIKQVSYEHNGPSSHFHIADLPFQLAEFCPFLQCIQPATISSRGSKLNCALGLTASGKLYLNQEVVANDCSSFTTDLDYLIYTTFSHQLKFIELSGLFASDRSPSAAIEPAMVQMEPARFNPSMVRAVERGSIIVSSVPSSMKVILQMPRGNIEAIHPRPMVLRSICLDFLKNGRWKEAFIQCRMHKIDFNLLVDFDRSKFIEDGISGLVAQVDNNEHFGLFLSSLKPTDVSTELYPITKNWKSSDLKDLPNTITDDQKINTVCDLMVEQLMKKQVQWGYINSILTAMVCKKPPDYKSALGLLTPLKSDFPEKVEDAIKYMIFLSDVNELYKFALSMYDLSLVILIAQHSQKDPKEYLPFLQSLRDLDLNMRKFKIDEHLGNYSSGLKHLSAAEDVPFAAVVRYTKLHSLYSQALEIYSKDLEKTKTLRSIQAEWLMEINKPFEAGLAFTLAGEVEKAVEGYKQAEAWQEMFALIIQHPDAFDLLENAKDMASRLSASGRYTEAATIFLEFADNVDYAISALCDSQAFSQAIRTALSKSRSALITEAILPAAEEFSQSFLEELDQLQEDLTKQVERLDELKLARETNPDLFFLSQKDGEEANDALEGVDAMTEATTIFRTDYSRYTQGIQPSGQSAMSSRSGRSSVKSSKMKKKEAKKKAAGKKGSIYEEEYLLNTLVKVCIQKLPTVQNTVGSLLPALVQLMSFSPSSATQLLETARKIQRKLEVFQANLAGQVQRIWDQREPKEPDEVDPSPAPAAPLRPPLSAVTVPRPVVPDSLAWKLTII
ncbi:hypothetical protein, variant [Puccinia triticina 1-1 BBBD Race 1]|uniref:Elongator complex protein 1 n=2 Tax=Puccinia triticina TaxID=208348 RepID=A0A180G657_PUCT1|nr:uncharacterized protein PtA15_17A388 [Puccinia triticina]OAV88161.1 hypothetical protein, variant [Puccinia triticina 1-1 BBBD Race 1]WAQ92906.1 hypothetical protein PtA15_17A388 [Puccinia triticina]WAR63799.1 hypothetical protein PtB15_17B400 [Puccinia triticina]